MKKFMAIYHSAPEAMAQMAEATPEQKEQGMKAWMAWNEKTGNALLDFGAPLMGGVNLGQNGATAESTKQVSGYSIVQAENAAAAQALFDQHPHFHWHPTASIEVHECVEM